MSTASHKLVDTPQLLTTLRTAEYNEATGALIREYVWLNGEPLAVIEGGVINYIRTDHIGRPVFATNSTGTKTWTASYLPFGEIRTTTDTPIALRFPGQRFQSESGLHQNWMRDYDPTTGRYLEADPLGLVDGASIYGYVKGNPGRWVDPRGEFGLVGAGLGAAGNFGLQMAFNIIYGKMSFLQAARCVNWAGVANAAFFGSLGGLPLGMIGKGVARRSASEVGKGLGVLGLATYNGIGIPSIRIGDECECKIENEPAWAKAVKSWF